MPSMMAPFLDGVPAQARAGIEVRPGVIIRPSPLGITYGHSGFMPGYQTELVYFPELKSVDRGAGEFERAAFDRQGLARVRDRLRGHRGEVVKESCGALETRASETVTAPC